MKSNTILLYTEIFYTLCNIHEYDYEYIGVPFLYRVVNNNFVAVGFCCMHNKKSKWKAYGCRFIVFHSIMLSIVFVWTVATECYACVVFVVGVAAVVAATSVAILFVFHWIQCLLLSSTYTHTHILYNFMSESINIHGLEKFTRKLYEYASMNTNTDINTEAWTQTINVNIFTNFAVNNILKIRIWDDNDKATLCALSSNELRIYFNVFFLFFSFLTVGANFEDSEKIIEAILSCSYRKPILMAFNAIA